MTLIKLLVAFSLIIGTPVFAEKRPRVLATSYLVQDLDTGEIIAEQNSKEIRSIASITKLMSAVVVLESGNDLDEMLKVNPIRGIASRLGKTTMSRSDLLILSLMSSDNLAAKTLAINHPGGEAAHVAGMNSLATRLGMSWSQFVDPTGLYNQNVSTGEDLVKLLGEAERHPFIKNASTTTSKRVNISSKKKAQYLDFRTTNRLILSIPHVVISKTGWISSAGGCLVMSIHDQGRRLAVILLNSKNNHTRMRDGELLYGLHHGKNF
jgi:D-alanyl-D-alanine endopeptidase (penicillin-binding protein 7)